MSATRPDEPQQRKRRTPLLWLWIVLAVALIALLLFVALPLLTGGGQVAQTPEPSVSASNSASPSPSASAASPSPTVDVGQGTFDRQLVDSMPDVLNSQNTAVLAQGGTFSNPVTVVVAQGSSPQTMSPQVLSPDDAVQAMQGMFTALDPNPWDFALSDAVLASYRAGPYGDYFPAGAIVARSHDGHVFSFIGHDSTITTMFMASSEDLLH